MRIVQVAWTVSILFYFIVRPGKCKGFEEKVCIGTNGRMSVPSNREHHYRNLRERYINCSYVDGNLELTWIQDENLDLSFLQHIREVTGYVLISHVHVKRVVLPRLQIIRGRSLFKLSIHKDQDFALLISLCKMHSIEMPALRDILSGGVGLFNNYNLCHIRTIDWKEIITGPGFKDVFVYDFTSPERECTPCDKSCEKGCWGEGSENCQKFSKINCSPQCSKGRCFGPNPRECCHLFCAGGCTGPKQSDCLACRDFYDDGECTQECPAMQTYNPTTYSWEANPKGKYAYGATCVNNCPEHLLKDNGACVRSCPPKKKAVKGECVPCDGPCPKTCPGVEQDGSVNSGNIDRFTDCTIIDGSITILDTTFQGYQQVFDNFTFGARHAPLHPNRLEVFSSVREVTGYLNIQGFHEDFKNLSYFRNLQFIGGRSLMEYFSLYIVKTSLTSLGLKSLKQISSGSIGILENKDLCFADGVSWSDIRKSPGQKVFVQNNRLKEECSKKGLVCHDQCTEKGCWGLGPDQCISCVNYKLGNTCLKNCSAVSGMYMAGPKECLPCHEQCESTCYGPGPGNCTSCRNVRDGPFCQPLCPASKFDDGGECVPCHQNCVGGCTGPENNIGPRGCISCEKAIITGDNNVSCLHKDEPCPLGYYSEYVAPHDEVPLRQLAGKAICRKCHPRCKKCTGYGFHVQVCQECANYRRGEQCEDECPQDHFPDESTQECIACDPECKGCYGPEASHCYTCRNFKLFLDDNGPNSNNTRFNCTAVCPPEAHHKIFPEDNREPYCSPTAMSSAHGNSISFVGVHFTLLIVIVVVLIIFMIFLCLIFYYCRNKAKTKKEQVKMTRVMAGIEDNEPLRPTNVKPNLAQLRIVREKEMRRGGILGYGAFGTVYKGVWVPEGENVKIPVAIKVLREDTGANTSKEFLDEAYIMASVDHPNLLQLLAVCMTSQMMLVTQLMPLGCLLDYVRNNRDKIGSKPLLNWCTQIARGMAYLEDKRLVHRDLAARNVLVQTSSCVKITDFGLAKLLDINEEVYKAGGGKMPIKWLALECIQHRIFTHKSDVWAFGVTVWELLTYGGRPYEHVPARDVPELLEKGERLPQPHICTIDVYMTMLKCWVLDADSRPGFKELADDFAKMSRDPGRYLVIPGDRLLRLPSYVPQQEDHPHPYPNSHPHLATPSPSPHPNAPTPPSDLRLPTSNLHHDYLNPHSTRPRPATSSTSGTSPPTTPTCKALEAATTALEGQEEDRLAAGGGWELLRYGRYCLDPIRGAGRDIDMADGICDSKPAAVGNLKLNLPLDEDDYLMPSPQPSQTTPTYMDVLGEKISDGTEFRNGSVFSLSFPDHLRSGAGKTNTCVDNPEYLLNSEQQQRTEGEIGIPIVSSGTFGPIPAQCLRGQKSSEEESDHEYYNDIAERELQPLRRNETTV